MPSPLFILKNMIRETSLQEIKKRVHFKCPVCNRELFYTFNTIYKGVRYCEFHYEIYIDRDNKRIEKLYDSWRDWFRGAIATGGKTVIDA